jgi:hypothetical protein
VHVIQLSRYPRASARGFLWESAHHGVD